MRTSTRKVAKPSGHGYKQSQLFEMENWLNSDQAAEYLGITANSLRIRISRGTIRPDARFGRLLRFRRESLDRLLSTNQWRTR